MGQFGHLYNDRRWRKKRLAHLVAQPLCVMCRNNGVVAVATIADHITPHRGDLDLFWNGELQSLCKMHHDVWKKQIEEKGYTNAVGVDGAPLDPHHPAHKE